MKAIGIRVSSEEVFYSVVEGTIENANIIDYNKIKLPKSFENSENLKWVRDQFISIFKEYKISALFVRSMETNIPKPKVNSIADRARLEGVILESAISSGLRANYGPLKTISSLIVTKKPKEYFSLEEFRGIDEWKSLNVNFKEATMAGVAALSLITEEQTCE